MFYQDLTYERLFADAARIGVSRESCATLRAWMPAGKIDQKRADAMQMLSVIEDRRRSGFESKIVDYELENTVTWRALVENMEKSEMTGEKS